MAISIKLAAALETIENVAPQAKVFSISFKLGTRNQVYTNFAPVNVAKEAEAALPGFGEAVISMSRSILPQAYLSFPEYLNATGIRNYLAANESKLEVVDVQEVPSASDDVFGQYSLGTDENQIFSDMPFGKISIEIK